MSYIPAKCLACGETLKRISNVIPNLVCIECKREFVLQEILS